MPTPEPTLPRQNHPNPPQAYAQMRNIEFREIMRDAELAHAIHPIVLKYLMTPEETTAALLACGVVRAKNVANIATSRFFDVPARLSET